MCFTMMAWHIGTANDTDGDAWFAAFFSVIWPVVALVALPVMWWGFIKKQKEEHKKRLEDAAAERAARAIQVKIDAAEHADFRGNS